jgi:hypothetical protein
MKIIFYIKYAALAVFSIYLIVGGINRIIDARTHKEGGYVFYEEPDRNEYTSNEEYKNHEYTAGYGMIFVGGIFLLCTFLIFKEKRKDLRAEASKAVL